MLLLLYCEQITAVLVSKIDNKKVVPTQNFLSSVMVLQTTWRFVIREATVSVELHYFLWSSIGKGFLQLLLN